METMSTFPIPQPIRTDGTNRFAADTMERRLPRNIRNIMEHNARFPPSVCTALERLAGEISGDATLPPPPLPGWDYDRWEREYALREGQRWHDTDWFFGETYAFRLILDRVRYFETLEDPYAPLKIRELDSGAPFLPIRCYVESREMPHIEKETLIEEAIHLSLWGNRADISFTAGGALDHSKGDSALLIQDDTDRIIRSLSTTDGTIHIVMDNSGAELAGDLVLAGALVDLLGRKVVLHPKLYPTYVSDTTPADIRLFLSRAEGSDHISVAEWARHLENVLDEGHITVAPDDYWCGVRFVCDMPARIARLFSSDGMVFIKGDFNYRRVFRDTLWPAEIDPVAAIGMTPLAPLALLRTMKSDCLVGVDDQTRRNLDVSEGEWRTAGKRGVLQFVPIGDR